MHNIFKRLFGKAKEAKEVKEVKKTRVLIAVPTFSHIENNTVKSIFDMQHPENTIVDFNYCDGYTVGLARNAIVETALKGNYDYVLWLDSDIIAPGTLLNSLLKIAEEHNDCGVVTGYYVKKIVGKAIAEVFLKNENGALYNLDEQSLIQKEVPYEINGCGFGCALTSCKVLRDIKTKYGMCFEYVLNKQNKLSEDLDFCIKVQKEGLKVYVDKNMRCMHIGKCLF